MIAQELEICLHRAFMDARQKRHEFITVEHLLLALLESPSASKVIRACSGDLTQLRHALGDFIETHTPVVSAQEVDTQPTLGFQRVIQRSILRVESAGIAEVTGTDVLLTIFEEQESHAAYFLHQQGITRAEVVKHRPHPPVKPALVRPGRADINVVEAIASLRVTCPTPVGEAAVELDPAQWEGTWLNLAHAEPFAVSLAVIEQSNGILRLRWEAHPEGTMNTFESGRLHVKHSGALNARYLLWSLGMHTSEDDASEVRYHWGIATRSGDQIVSWLPKPDGFNAPLISARLPGQVSGDRVRLGALTAEHWQIIRSEDSVLSPSAQGMTTLFAWEEPWVFARIP